MIKWTDVNISRAVELKKNGYSYAEVANEMTLVLGERFTFDMVRGLFRRNPELLESGTDSNVTPALTPKKRVSSINADGTQSSTIPIRMTEEQAKSPEFVLKAHGFDSKLWRIKTAKNNLWQQNSIEKGLVDLYQSTIVVEPIHGLSDEEFIAAFVADIKPVVFPTVDTAYRADEHRNLVLAQADLHFGVTKISDLTDKVERLVDIINNGYNTIVFEQLGDIFHSAQMRSSVTVKGTILEDVDTVQAIEDAKTFYDALISEALKNAQRVEFRSVIGNHNESTTYMFAEYLRAKYPQLVVINNIKYRDAYLLDNVGILIAHGDYANKKLPMLFANEFGEVWANSQSRELHLGHFHTQKTIDEGGVYARSFGTIKPNDQYEIANGYTMNTKTMYALEYDSDQLRMEYHV